jgi:geranylgeranyl diphosphate synthase type II
MTVHEKWDVNTGFYRCAMLILAYQYFEQYEPAVLCDWQNCLVKRRLKSVKGQWDVDFETRDDVTIPELK